jgi:hypothetical protein
VRLSGAMSTATVITVFSCASFSGITVRPSCAELLYTATLAESEGLMFGGLNKKAARQSLFNVEINARRLILVSNKAYQADPDDKQAFRAATEKILKVEDDLYRDISLALDNGGGFIGGLRGPKHETRRPRVNGHVFSCA